MLTLPQFKLYSWKTNAFTPPLVYDRYYSNTTLLINAGGISTFKTNNVFVDNSPNNFTVVSTGSTTQQGSFSPFDPNGWSIYTYPYTVANQHNYVSFPAISNVPGHGLVGAGKTFTVEGWFYCKGAGGGVLTDGNLTNSSYWNIYLDGNRRPVISWFDGSGKTVSSLTTPVPLEEWTHMAWVASAGNLSMYVGGIKQQLNSGQVLTNPRGTINSYTKAFGNFNGYASNFRVLTGTALYSADFNPPTTQLSAIPNTALLIAQDNRFKDNSQYNRTLTISNSATIQPFAPFKKYTYSNNISRYFNGATILSAAPSQDFNMGVGNFTIDFWIRSERNQGNNNQYSNRVFGIKKLPSVGSNADESIYFELNLFNKAQIYVNSGTTIYGAIDSENFPINRWVHMAIVRNGASLNLYRDGKLAGTKNIGGITLNFSNFGMSFGGKDYYPNVQPYNTKYANFHIFNLRIVKGQPLYVGDFTPPTAITNGSTVGATGNGVPTQTITGTISLLAFQDKTNTDYSPSPKTIGSVLGTTIYDRTNPFLIDTLKNPIKYSKISHGGSMYFDGTNTLTSNFNKLEGTGDFTIEMWIYPTGYAQIGTLFDRTPSEGIVGDYPVLRYSTNKTLQYLANNNGVVMLETTTVEPFQWTHIAISRKNSITKLFVNGNQNGGSCVDYTNFLSSSQCTIGGSGFASSADRFIGYIANYKILVDNALYDANFIPVNTPYKYDAGIEFHLTFNNAYVVDSTGNTNIQTLSSNSFSDSYGGIYFDGTGHLKIPHVSYEDTIHSAQTDVPYTIEGYFLSQESNRNAFKTLIAKKSSTGTDYELCLSGAANSILYYNGGTLMYAGIATTDGGTSLSSGCVSAFQWTHIAVVYDGANYSIYKNGNRIYKYLSHLNSTGTQTATNNLNRNLYIGNSYPFNRKFVGNMKNIRITKGVARYTENSFTVPTEFPTQ